MHNQKEIKLRRLGSWINCFVVAGSIGVTKLNSTSVGLSITRCICIAIGRVSVGVFVGGRQKGRIYRYGWSRLEICFLKIALKWSKCWTLLDECLDAVQSLMEISIIRLVFNEFIYYRITSRARSMASYCLFVSTIASWRFPSSIGLDWLLVRSFSWRSLLSNCSFSTGIYGMIKTSNDIERKIEWAYLLASGNNVWYQFWFWDAFGLLPCLHGIPNVFFAYRFGVVLAAQRAQVANVYIKSLLTVLP